MSGQKNMGAYTGEGKRRSFKWAKRHEGGICRDKRTLGHTLEGGGGGEVKSGRSLVKVEYVGTIEHGGIHCRGEEEEKFKVECVRTEEDRGVYWRGEEEEKF